MPFPDERHAVYPTQPQKGRLGHYSGSVSVRICIAERLNCDACVYVWPWTHEACGKRNQSMKKDKKAQKKEGQKKMEPYKGQTENAAP